MCSSDLQLEAMAHGVPVIASERTGEVVVHEHNGLLVRAGDSRELAQAMVRLSKDLSLLGELSRNALTTVERFSRRAVSGLWASVVSES